MTRKSDAREERVLARPMIQAGIERAPGETVRLRPDQIERLQAQGYLAGAKAKAAAGGAAAGDAARAGNETKEAGR